MLLMMKYFFNELLKRNANQMEIDKLRNDTATAEAIEKEKTEYSQSLIDGNKFPYNVNELYVATAERDEF